MMLKLTLVLFVFYSYRVQVEGYGYRYNYMPQTGQSNLWTFLPGHEQPVVYSYQPGEPWPQIYSVNYDGLLPGQPAQSSKYSNSNEDPNLYKYRGPDGKYRYKCKPDAYYSEYQQKCLWKPGYYKGNRA